MRQLTKPLAWGLMIAFAGIVGCESPSSGGPADPVASQEAISATVPGLVDNTIGSLEFLGESEIVNSLDRGMSAMDGSFASLPLFGETEEYAKRFFGRSGEAEEEEFSGEDLAEFLMSEVFTEENYEGDGVFLLHGEDFCPEGDTECIETFDEIGFRVRAVLAEDGVDLTLLVGPDRDEPLLLELRPNRATLEADLAEAKQALTYIGSVTGESFDLPTVMEGKPAITLVRNGEADITLSVAVREAINIEGELADGKGTIKFGTEAKDPLFSLHAQGLEKILTVEVDIGATTLSVPWEAVNEESLAEGTLAVALMGFSASVVLEEDASSLAVTNVGFGDDTSTIMLDDSLLFALDLNPDSGRRFDITITPAVDLPPTFAFAPEMDLSLAFHLQPLADAGDEIESFLLDETYEIAFTGDAPACNPVEPTDEFIGGLEISSGSLAISSTAAADAIIVEAGQCLVGDELEDGEHPVLGHLTVTDCP